jgi:hypothetical protein
MSTHHTVTAKKEHGDLLLDTNLESIIEKTARTIARLVPILHPRAVAFRT